MVFDGFRRSFEDLLSRATRPEERRVVAARMKETLVQARMGLDDLRTGLVKASALALAQPGQAIAQPGEVHHIEAAPHLRPDLGLRAAAHL